MPDGAGESTHDGVSVSPDTADSAPGSDSLARLEARGEERREAAAKRRRRRRLLFATPFLGLLCWAIGLVRDLDARADEHAVRGAQRRVGQGGGALRQLAGRRSRARLLQRNAPKKGGPAPKRLPAVGLSPCCGQTKDARTWPPPIKPVFAAPAPRRGDLEADRAARRWRPAGARDDLPPRNSTTRRSSPTSPGSTTRAPRSATTRAATSRRTRPCAGR